MAIRGTMLVPSSVTKTLVCINGYKNFDIEGRLINLYMPEPVDFSSVYDIVNIMECFFDEISYPQRHYEDRAFTPKPSANERKKKKSEVRKYMSDEVLNNEKGRKATFMIQVQFRQNSTWQGTITWTDEKKTQRFRSTLEMIKLMDGAMSSCGEEQDIYWE